MTLNRGLLFSFLFLVIFQFTINQACKDESPHCVPWEKAGYCNPKSQFSGHVVKNCKQTCGKCKASSQNCRDVSGYCSSYQPYCNDPGYKDYLIKQCKQTCKFCHLTTVAPSTTPFVSTQPYTGASGRVLQPGCGKKGASHTRIVGGKNANPGDWPWQVNIDYKYNSGNPGHHCGGTLINEEWILSAAHCFYNDQIKENYWLKLGEHDIKTSSKWEQRFNVTQLILHPKYNPNGHDHDLALLRINGTASLNDRVRPACLPGRNTSFDIGTKCFITGWGLLKEYGVGPAILQQAQVPLIERKTCKDAFSPLDYDVTTNMLCAGYSGGQIDSCDGDSGGPLVCKKYDTTLREDIWYLHGAISWGVGCARKGFYGVYASPKVMRPWIDQIVFKN